MDPEEFYARFLPYASSVSERTGVDPKLVLAQAALETGYGRSAPNNNFFGIKSHGRGGGEQLMTSEFEGGEMVRKPQSFRGYADPSQSFDDYASFLLENPRYRDVLSAEDLPSQIAAMGVSGYATDPDYAAKLSQIASRFPGASDAGRESYVSEELLNGGSAGDILSGDPRVGAALSGGAGSPLTESEAQKYVSEDFLPSKDEDSFLDKLGKAAEGMDVAKLFDQPKRQRVRSLDMTYNRPRPNSGSRALQRMGIASLA